jgi:hypothetical protein
MDLTKFGFMTSKKKKTDDHDDEKKEKKKTIWNKKGEKLPGKFLLIKRSYFILIKIYTEHQQLVFIR